ncbi:hypothetical protein GGI20_005269 [Coemansia sp. BCRC 34301]|nr:hypothetical protein GGI20_005269 [Coemansia sp. BCRC 34301]
MVKSLSLVIASLAVAISIAYGAPQPVATETPGVEFYQGLHLPPGLRSRRRAAMHRRDIPYGGFVTFGNMPMQTGVPANGQKPCNEKAGDEGRRKPLLGLIDVDLDLHL